MDRPVSSWGPSEVCAWVSASDANLGQYAGLFQSHNIDGTKLVGGLLTPHVVQLSEAKDDGFLKDIGIKNANHRKIFKKQISFLRETSENMLEQPPQATPGCQAL